MPSFMDKMKHAAGGVAEATKKGAATAQTKAKVHGLRGKADEAAQKLGYLVHRERTGGEPAGPEADQLVTQISELQTQIADMETAEATDSGGSETESGGSETESGGSETTG
jgi:hypothetical protein